MPTRALQEATLLVLTALSRGSQHGSGIITDVQEISGGRVRLRAGTLYAALDRLRADGLIGVEREEVVASRLRRYYRLLRAPAPAARPHLASGPDLRIGDADRETAAATLGEHFAQGRLTLEELIARLDVTFTATRQSEITQTTQDLPLPVPAWMTEQPPISGSPGTGGLPPGRWRQPRSAQPPPTAPAHGGRGQPATFWIPHAPGLALHWKP